MLSGVVLLPPAGVGGVTCCQLGLWHSSGERRRWWPSWETSVEQLWIDVMTDLRSLPKEGTLAPCSPSFLCRRD